MKRKIKSEYDLEMERVLIEIKRTKAKLVCIQLPDGLKSKTRDIVDTIEEESQASVLIWMGDCYGACDLPISLNNMNVDLLIQWGHNLFLKNKKGWE